MQTIEALGFSAEIEQKGDEMEFFLFIASPISWKLFSQFTASLEFLLLLLQGKSKVCLVDTGKYRIPKHSSYVEVTLNK